ncbi:MAG: hypothetical protein WCT37_03585 [Patescibacteria group bacterium]|jgi:hypothetical protein
MGYFAALKKEKVIAGVIIAAVLLLTLLPSIYGALTAGPGYRFFGHSGMLLYDYPVYLSQIEQARQGQWLFYNLYTSEPQTAVFFSPVWLLLGKLGALTGINNGWMFIFGRLLAAAGLISGFYFLLRRLFENSAARLTGLFLAFFVSGLGIWFAPWDRDWDYTTFFYSLPVDLWVAESNTFLTLYHSPLFPLSQLLILAIFYWWWLAPKNRWWAIGLASLFLGIIHPYDLITVGAAPAVYLAVDWLRQRRLDFPALKSYLWILIGGLPAGLYYVLITSWNSVAAGWARQNITLSPPVGNYLVGYGLILTLAIFGAILVIKQKQEKFYFVVVWAVTGFFLLYAPVNFQRRFTNGLHLALIILTVVCLVELWPRLYRQRTFIYGLAPLIIFFLILSNLAVVATDLKSYQKKAFPYLIPAEVSAAAEWLKNESAPEAVIISDIKDGNVLPALTGRRVYYGHGHQTIGFGVKARLAENWFWRVNHDPAAEWQFLTENNITYLWYSARERALGNFNPAAKDYLTEVYRNSGVVIYRVDPIEIVNLTN